MIGDFLWGFITPFLPSPVFPGLWLVLLFCANPLLCALNCVRACVRVQVLLLYLFIQKGWEIFICFSYYSLCYSKSKYSILCKQFWGQLVLNSSLYLVWLNLILALFMTDLFILLFSDSNLNLVFQYLCLLSHDSLVYPSWDFHNILGLDLRVWGHVIQFLTQCKD